MYVDVGLAKDEKRDEKLEGKAEAEEANTNDAVGVPVGIALNALTI